MSAPLLSCQSINKSFGSRVLFKNLTFSISRGDRIGMIGPNGSGKSTLIKLLVQQESPETGTISYKRGLHLGYVPQDSSFPDLSVEEVLYNAFAEDDTRDDRQRQIEVSIMLSKLGFEDTTVNANSLSGGWKKRLDLAKELIKKPDILFLDEPTNHLDLEGIAWLENFLQRQTCAYLIVSHDRYFLQNVTNKMMELNKSYPNGVFCVDVSYNQFIDRRNEFIEGQLQYERALNSKVRGEIEWLRKTPQARTTKSSARIQEAERLIEELSDVKTRNKSTNVKIDFASTERQTRKLIAAKNLSKTMGDRTLFSGVSFNLAPGTRLGLVGANGSGKSTLLKLLAGTLQPDTGTIKIGDGVRIIYFDQHRLQLPRNTTLRDALSENSDSVTYRGQNIHVNSWCKRFLFDPSDLDMPLSHFSGGERARILIARLMLQPADVLLLDEPTNDLDIPTLEILEEGLQDFPGALVLVTHDRYMMQQLCNVVIGLGGGDDISLFADYAQWEASLKKAKETAKELAKGTTNTKTAEVKSSQSATPTPAPTKKLSYNEKRELEQMEGAIHKVEEQIKKLHAEIESPQVAGDPAKLQDACQKLSANEAQLETLYARWQELESRSSG